MRKIITLITILTCTSLFIACDDVMDTHKEFIKGGEIIYAPMPDTVFFIAGKNRLEMNYVISKSPNVKSIIVYWNNFQDSLVTPLDLTSGIHTGKVMIDGLLEKSYTFTTRLRDKYGHKSLNTVAFGTSYGENYQNSLSNRRMSRMSLTDGGGVIGWEIAPAGLVRNEVRYTDREGKEVSIWAAADQTSTQCPGAPTGGSVDFRSAYIPVEACVDTFYTAWVNSGDLNMRFPHAYGYGNVDRGNWEVLYFDNSDPDEGRPSYMFDNNDDSYWHSNYHNTGRYPYTFVVDMKQNQWIGKLGAQQRKNIFYSRGMSFYVTADAQYAGNPDGNNWTYLGDVELHQENGMQWRDVSNDVLEKGVQGRYLKLVFTSGYNGDHLGAISEISIQRVATVDGVNASEYVP